MILKVKTSLPSGPKQPYVKPHVTRKGFGDFSLKPFLSMC